MAQVKVERVGDVLGCRFDGEDEVALFLQGSGDVLLASLAQWQSLVRPSVAPLNNLSVNLTLVVEPNPPEPLDELRSTLLGLGAALQ